MPRVKRSVHARKKRRTVLARAKGYYGAKSRSYRAAKEQVQHSLQYMYRDRRNKKREIRRLWITRINAAARINGLSYSWPSTTRPPSPLWWRSPRRPSPKRCSNIACNEKGPVRVPFLWAEGDAAWAG